MDYAIISLDDLLDDPVAVIGPGPDGLSRPVCDGAGREFGPKVFENVRQRVNRLLSGTQAE